MKKFLSLIVGLVLSLSAYSQAKIDYPKFETDSNNKILKIEILNQ